jgi:hypothetical protein
VGDGVKSVKGEGLMEARVQPRLEQFLGTRPGEVVAGYYMTTHWFTPTESCRPESYQRVLESLPDGGWVDFWCPSRRTRGTFVREYTKEVWRMRRERKDEREIRRWELVKILPEPEWVYMGCIWQIAKLGPRRVFRGFDVHVDRGRGVFRCSFCGEERPLAEYEEHLPECLRRHLTPEMRVELRIPLNVEVRVIPDVAEAVRQGYNWGVWLEWEETGEFEDYYRTRYPEYISSLLAKAMCGAEVEVRIHMPLAPPPKMRVVELAPPPKPKPEIRPPPREVPPIIVPEVLSVEWATGVPERVKREVEERLPGVKVDWEAVRREVMRRALMWRMTHQGLWKCPICGAEVPGRDIVRHWARVHGMPPETLCLPVRVRLKGPPAVVEKWTRRIKPVIEVELPQEVEVELVEEGT